LQVAALLTHPDLAILLFADTEADDLHPPDPEHTDKNNIAASAAAPPSFPLVLTNEDSAAAVCAPLQ
jgi:hypothetical protein